MKLGQIFIFYTKYSKFNKQYNNIMSTGSFGNKSQHKLDSLVADTVVGQRTLVQYTLPIRTQ